MFLAIYKFISSLFSDWPSAEHLVKQFIMYLTILLLLKHFGFSLFSQNKHEGLFRYIYFSLLWSLLCSFTILILKGLYLKPLGTYTMYCITPPVRFALGSCVCTFTFLQQSRNDHSHWVKDHYINSLMSIHVRICHQA